MNYLGIFLLSKTRKHHFASEEKIKVYWQALALKRPHGTSGFFCPGTKDRTRNKLLEVETEIIKEERKWTTGGERLASQWNFSGMILFV